MKKSLLLLSTLLLTTSGFAQDSAKELFMQKCSACHVLQIPQDRSTLAGPPARGLMFHMNEAFDSREKKIAHIEDFVMNPSLEKAICRSVRRFGVMPSQKGLITKDELTTVANWMVDNLSMSQQEHDKLQRKHQAQ